MASEDQHIWEVISSVLAKNPSLEEKQLFEKWINENSSNREKFEIISHIGYTGDEEHMKAVKKDVYEKIMNKALASQRLKKTRLIRYLTAASVTLLLGIGTWVYITKSLTKEALVETQVPFGKQSKIV